MFQLISKLAKLFRKNPAEKKHIRVIMGENFIAAADINEAVRNAEPTTQKIRELWDKRKQ